MALPKKVEEVKGSYRVTTKAFRTYLIISYRIGGGVARVQVKKRYWFFGWRWRWALTRAEHIHLDVALFSESRSYLYADDKDKYGAYRCIHVAWSGVGNPVTLNEIEEQGIVVNATTKVGGQTFKHRVGAGSYSE